jgi:hypothetical protein
MAPKSQPYDHSGNILISQVAERADPRSISARNPNLWKAVPYTTDEFDGTMLGCGPGPRPVSIDIQLNVTGWHRVWVGLFSFCHSGALRLRLSSDTCCRQLAEPQEIRNDLYGQATYLHETFWRDADLTGQSLIVEPSFGMKDLSDCALAFLRLEPISKPEAARPRPVEHPLAVTNDGHGIFGQRPHFRPEDLLEDFELIPDQTSMRMLMWGIGDGDMCNYPTAVGNFFPTHGTFANRHRNVLYQNMRQWRKQGWDSLELMRNYTSRRGWEFYPYIRMEAFDAPYPFDPTSLHSQFFHRHPQFHCFDSRGQRVMRLSYAYPEVQEHMLELIGEISGYSPDGVCLAFIRGVPLVLYEQIMVDGFTRRHGLDPRGLAETDPRWLAYQAEILTAFVEKARACLKPGQRLSAIVPGNAQDCRHWGLDVAAWVRSGLVDDLVPVGQKMNAMDVHEDDASRLEFDWFSSLEGRQSIRLLPMLYTWDLYSRDYPAWRDLLHSCLDRGADMYGVWDGTPQNGETSLFTRADIGYADREETEPAPAPAGCKYQLLTLDGFRNDRYQYFEVV